MLIYQKMKMIYSSKILLASIFALFVCAAHAQVCSTSLPSNAIPVTSSENVTGNNLNHWVCTGGDLNRSGNNGVTVIEDGGVGTFDGDGLEVWILSGAEAIINGTQHTIYVDNGGSAIVNAFQCDIHIVPGATVMNNGGLFNTIHSCSSISIDYSNAPSGGCFPAGVPQYLDLTSSSIEVLPDPPGNLFTIEGTLSLFNLEVQNLFGGIAINIPSSGSTQTVDLNPLSPGNYFLVATSNASPDLQVQLLISR